MKNIGAFLLLFISLNVNAQSVIKGKIYAGKDIVPGANVFLKNTYDGASSNANGEFSFKTSEKGIQTIVVSCVGFENYEKQVELNSSELILKISLKEKANELNTVTITAGTFEAGADIKKATILSSLDIVTTAGAEADIYSAIQTLPGAQAANQEEGLFVRGGAAYETKTLFDGMWVQKPFMNDVPNVSQRGRFSAFEFKGTTFSSGAYSAQYGQALSSVLTLDSKDLADKTSSDIGIMTAGITAGHTERRKKSSYNINAAYFDISASNALFKQNIDWKRDPKSISFGGNYRLKTSATGMLKVFNSTSRNSMALRRANLDPIDTKMLIDNTDLASYTNITYQEYLNDDWKINMGSAINIEDNTMKLDSNNLVRKDYLNQYRVALNGYINKKLQAKFGVDYVHQSKEEKYNTFQRNFIEDLSAVFAEFDYYFNYKWVLRAGLRNDYSSRMSVNSIVPRLSIAYKQNKLHQYSIAYGDFVQNPVDDYLVQSKSLEFEKAKHLLFNYQFQTEKYILRVEAFAKKYDQLVCIDNLNNLNNSGTGYANGVDIFWRDKKSIKRGDYWISYSYLDTKRKYRNYPSLVQPSFAATHTLNIVYKQYFPKIQTQFGATYSIASGRPYYNPNNVNFMQDKTPVYQNLSFNASYLTSIKSHFTVVFLSVGNAFGIKNVFGYQYSNDGSRRMAIEPNAPRSIFVGMFISIGEDNVL